MLVRLVGDGAEVRLDNRHLVRAALGCDGGLSAGRPVAVELSPDDVRGWRIAPRNPEQRA